MSYWISDGISQNGPYPLDELPLRGLRADSLVWTEGMAEWQRAADVQAVRPFIPSTDHPSRDAAPAPWPAQSPVNTPANPATPPPWQPPAQPSAPSGQGNLSAGNPQPVQPIGYQAAYPQSYGYGPPLPQGTAVASMVLGILSLVLISAYCFGVVPGILAVIFGHMSMGRIRSGTEAGKSMATAGLICGYISLGLTALAVIGLGIVFLFAVTLS